MLADHHLDIDAEIVGRAEDFDDTADGRLDGRGPAGDLDIDDQAFEIVVVAGALRLRSRGRDAVVASLDWAGSSSPRGMTMCCVMRSSKGTTMWPASRPVRA